MDNTFMVQPKWIFMLTFWLTSQSILTVGFQKANFYNHFKYYKLNICHIAEIHQSHYALDLIKKMLEREPGNRISSKTVVVQLKSIEGKVFK
jgi:hypothetical protein